jgi:lysophospholipase L1-like esterase
MDRERLAQLVVAIAALATVVHCSPDSPFVPPEAIDASADVPRGIPVGIPVGHPDAGTDLPRGIPVGHPDASIDRSTGPDDGSVRDARSPDASEAPAGDANTPADVLRSDLSAAPDQPRTDAPPDTITPFDQPRTDAPPDTTTPFDQPRTDAPPDTTTPFDAAFDSATARDVPSDDIAATNDVASPDVSPPDGAAAVDPLLAVPTFDTETIAHIRALRALGATRGMRANVFAKIGDSITESQSFLYDIGQGWYVLGNHGALEATIQYFRATRFADGSNSLTRASACAMSGWLARYALAMEPMSALHTELAYTRPGYAIVMYGTNDLDRMPPASFIADMNRIVDVIEANGTVPVLSTIPDRLDRPDAAAAVPGFNAAIRELARTRHLPLMDYWAALQSLPRRGLDTDGIHPSAYVTPSGVVATGVLTSAALQYGYNMRNLVVLLALERLRTLP